MSNTTTSDAFARAVTGMSARVPAFPGTRGKKALAAIAAVLSLGLLPARAHAEHTQVPAEVRYGPAPGQFGELFAGGPALVLLLHENGLKWKSVQGEAEKLQGSGFTVLDLEWERVGGAAIWGGLTAQVEAAVRYARSNAATLGIDPERVAMLGGSRGANLATLTALNMNQTAPGTIKTVVSLSGDVDPIAQVDRLLAARERGELTDKRSENKISESYGCKPHLLECPISYLEQWSPREKVESGAGPTAPAMMLAASEHEETTAYFGDQEPMAEALERSGVPADVVFSGHGHGFAYWSRVHKAAIQFLATHDVRGG